MKHLKIILLLICCTAITACSKKEEPVAEYEVGDKTVKVYENDSNTEKSFELINNTITAELGESLGEDISKYVKAKNPENITRSYSRYEGPWEVCGEDVITFKDENTGFTQDMTVIFQDTIHPKLVSEGTIDIKVYLKQYDFDSSPISYDDFDSRDIYVNINGEEYITSLYQKELLRLCNIEYEDASFCTTYFENEVSDHTQSYDGSSQLSLISINPSGTEGTFVDNLIIEDKGNNQLKVPVTITFTNEESPIDLNSPTQIQESQIQKAEEDAALKEQMSQDAEAFEQEKKQLVSDILDEIENSN